MKLVARSMPLGHLPYTDIRIITRMIAKLFEKNPYCPVLPLLETEDSVMKRTLSGIPCVRSDGKNIKFVPESKFKSELEDLDKAFHSFSQERLEKYSIDAPFFEKYTQIIKKFKSPNPYFALIGPFTLSQILSQLAGEQLLLNKIYRKLIIQAISVKAAWVISKIKEMSPSSVPIIILEEPQLPRFGEIRRANEDVTSELVAGMYSKLAEKMHSLDAYLAVQCMDKCDWSVPIDGGVDMISFDAYNNPNNLNIMPEKVIEFVSKGGKICWGIIPVMTEQLVKALSLDMVRKRLFATFDGLILAGVPQKFVYNSSIVSTQGNLDHLPIIFAEKALMLTSQLAKKIPVKS